VHLYKIFQIAVYLRTHHRIKSVGQNWSVCVQENQNIAYNFIKLKFLNHIFLCFWYTLWKESRLFWQDYANLLRASLFCWFALPLIEDAKHFAFSSPTLTMFLAFQKCPLFSVLFLSCFSYILCLWPIFDIGDFEQFQILLHAMRQNDNGGVMNSGFISYSSQRRDWYTQCSTYIQ